MEFLFLPVTILFLLSTCISLIAVNGQSVENLPPADQIVNLTERYHLESTLHAQVSEDRIFPSIRFTHNGSIIGWQFPAAPGVGLGRPSISVLRLIVNNRYERVSQTEVDSCTVRTYQLGDGFDVELHESGPASPIPFKEGDIFGLHLRNSRANFVPYLYNSTLSGEKERLSYYLPRTAIRDDEVNLDVISSDSLQPLFALITCATDSTHSVDLGIPLCNGETLLNSITCLELATTGSGIVSTCDSSPPQSLHLLAIQISVPIVSVLVIACVIGLIVCIVSYCKGSKRQTTGTRSTGNGPHKEMQPAGSSLQTVSVIGFSTNGASGHTEVNDESISLASSHSGYVEVTPPASLRY